jgi:hypothetical protein
VAETIPALCAWMTILSLIFSVLHRSEPSSKPTKINHPSGVIENALGRTPDDVSIFEEATRLTSFGAGEKPLVPTVS